MLILSGSEPIDFHHKNDNISQGNRNKNRNKPMGPNQTNKLLHSKGNHKNKTKRQPTKWEKKIVSNNATDKGLTSKIYKQLIQLNRKKPTTQLENGQKTWIDISPKIYRWPTGTWKNAQHHSLLEKCKSKLLWGTTSQLLEWPSLISSQITNSGEGSEKKESSYTVGGNVNWYSHYGR